MSIPQETLKLLTVMSLQSKQNKKALKYAQLGYDLFSEDIECIELLAASLLKNQEVDKALEITNLASIDTRNINYVKSRILLIQKSKNSGESILKYLQSA